MLEANACIAVQWFSRWSVFDEVFGEVFCEVSGKFSIISLHPITLLHFQPLLFPHTLWTMCFHETALVWPSVPGLRRPPFMAHATASHSKFSASSNWMRSRVHIHSSKLASTCYLLHLLTAFRRRFADSRNYIDLVSFVEVVQRQHTMQRKLPTKYFKIWRLMELKPDSYFCSIRQPQPHGHKIVVFSYL